MAFVIPDFIAAGGNRHPAAADWDTSGSGLLAYGADCNVGIWRPADRFQRGVHALLRGHTDVVNVVKFIITSKHNSPVLLTGSADKSIRSWLLDGSSPTEFRAGQVLDKHESALNTITTCGNFFASASADANVKIWKFDSVGEDGPVISFIQNIALAPTYFPLAVDCIHFGTHSSVALAVAGTKNIIQIHVAKAFDSFFALAATLTGHDGWIRSLAFTRDGDDPACDILLASASQDKYIRLWRLHEGEELPSLREVSNDPLLGTLKKSLSNKAYRFTSETLKYSITFEALLVGHEDWIYSAKWGKTLQSMQLLTASADSSLSIWTLDEAAGMWVCSVRLGEISAQKGATTATGSVGGFWTGLWSPDCSAIVALGRTGSWRQWRYHSQTRSWESEIGVSGHTRAVQSIAWSKDGSYLLSTSSDQTTRLFAEWKQRDGLSWHELSRPQIHGYDLNCIETFSTGKFVTGADEKLLRVFDQPNAVARLRSKVSGIHVDAHESLMDTASIPVMGLSNKAVTSAIDEHEREAPGVPEENGEDVDNVHNVLADIDKPPLEDQLGRHLLWPETEKLYGHGYEVCTVAANHQGTLVATACRASSIEHAVIRLFETETWQELKPPLKGHSLTVTGLQFSDDDQFLLSVGRDRQCFVWKKNADATNYDCFASNAKAHSRMILACAWLPTNPQRQYVFSTVGRDGSLQIWALEDNEMRSLASRKPCTHPITAVSVLPVAFDEDAYYLACGCENGSFSFLKYNMATKDVTVEPVFADPPLARHDAAKAITALAWRPPRIASGSMTAASSGYQLALASEDASLRIYRVSFESSNT